MTDEAHEGSSSRRLSTWAIAGLGLAVMVMLFGLGSTLFPHDGGSVLAPTGSSPSGIASGFAPGTTNPSSTNPGTPNPSTSASAAGSGESQWGYWGAPTFRLGFSFVVAYLAAYAVRFIFKTAMLGAGFAILLLVGLQAAGIIDIHWNIIETKGGTAASWLKDQTQTVEAFLKGYLPGAGAASVGFIAGLRSR